MHKHKFKFKIGSKLEFPRKETQYVVALIFDGNSNSYLTDKNQIFKESQLLSEEERLYIRNNQAVVNYQISKANADYLRSL